MTKIHEYCKLLRRKSYFIPYTSISFHIPPFIPYTSITYIFTYCALLYTDFLASKQKTLHLHVAGIPSILLIYFAYFIRIIYMYRRNKINHNLCTFPVTKDAGIRTKGRIFQSQKTDKSWLRFCFETKLRH